jgi:hypothetical protein
LQSISFDLISPGWTFTTQIYLWDAINRMLLGSPVFSVTSAPAFVGGWTSLTLDPNVALNPGTEYVILFTTLGVPNTISGYTSFGATTADWPGGTRVYSAFGAGVEGTTPIASLSGVQFGVPGVCDAYAGFYCQSPNNDPFDLAFSATFTSSEVPEPSSLSLIALGTVIVWWRWRRSRVRLVDQDRSS